VIQSLRDFRTELTGLANDAGSAGLALARAQFNDAANRAALGDAKAAGQLPDLGRGLLKVAAEQSATREDFLRELVQVTSAVDAAEATAVRQKSIAEQQLDALNNQFNELIDINKGQLTISRAVSNLEQAQDAAARARDQLNATTQQVAALGLINTGQLTISQGIRNLEQAEAAATSARTQLDVATQQLTALGLINNSVLSLGDQLAAALGGLNAARAQQTAAAAAQQAAAQPAQPASSSINISNINAPGAAELLASAVVGSPSFVGPVINAVQAAAAPVVSAAKTAVQSISIKPAAPQSTSVISLIQSQSGAVKKFASGGDFGGGLRLVGENGPELEATGPSRIFNAQKTQDILRGGGNNEAMVIELKAVREELALLRAEAQSVAVSSAKTKDILMRATDGGDNYILTKAAS
jgi:exonuclease VII small subunit